MWYLLKHHVRTKIKQPDMNDSGVIFTSFDILIRNAIEILFSLV